MATTITDKRLYTCKDVEMMVTIKTISENFKRYILELAAVRTNWTPEYAEGLITRIDGILHTHLGIDSKKDFRSATTVAESMQFPARRDISYFKTQIEDDFKKDPTKRD